MFLIKNTVKSTDCDSDQARYSRLKFTGVAAKKLEGLCVGILKFFPSVKYVLLNASVKGTNTPTWECIVTVTWVYTIFTEQYYFTLHAFNSTFYFFAYFTESTIIFLHLHSIYPHNQYLLWCLFTLAFNST